MTAVQHLLINQANGVTFENSSFSHLIGVRGWHKGDAGISGFRMIPFGYVPPGKPPSQSLNTDQHQSNSSQMKASDQMDKDERVASKSQNVSQKQAKAPSQSTLNRTHQPITNVETKHKYRFRGGHESSSPPGSAEQSLLPNSVSCSNIP